MAILTSVFPAIATANLIVILAGVCSTIQKSSWLALGKAIVDVTAKAALAVTCARVCEGILKATSTATRIAFRVARQALCALVSWW